MGVAGGCTYFCHSVDVGINRPIKRAITNKWEDWLDAERLKNGIVIKTSPQEYIATWVIEAYLLL